MNLRTPLLVVGLLAAVALIDALLFAPRSAPASESERDETNGPCLSFKSGGTELFKLKLMPSSLLLPSANTVGPMSGVLNGLEPALGASWKTGANTSTFSMQGTQAGFFLGLTVNWDASKATGTGRVLTELNVHKVTVSRLSSCP